MKVKIKLCCSSLEPELCTKVERNLRSEFPDVKKGDGIFEHVVTTELPTYEDAEKLVNRLHAESNGQIALIDYVVTSHR